MKSQYQVIENFIEFIQDVMIEDAKNERDYFKKENQLLFAAEQTGRISAFQDCVHQLKKILKNQ